MSELKKFYCFMGSFFLIAISWISWNYFCLLYAKPGIEICILKRTVGLACPSCGTTRSILHILHGDLISAFFFNPLGIVLFPGIVLMPFWVFYDYWYSKRTLWGIYQYLLQNFQNKKFILVVIVLILLNWFWNIQKGI